MDQLKQKTSALLETLPYIQKFHGKIVVIKYGGQIMDATRHKRSLLRDIVFLKYIGLQPIVLHGGGPSITKEMARRKIVVEFVDGLRVTDAETVKIVAEVFKKTNEHVSSVLESYGSCTVGLLGDRDKLFTVVPQDKRLGLVGKITKVQTKKILQALATGCIPVISPLGVDAKGTSYNINADTAAAALAVALKAEKLTLVSDVDGVYDGKKFLSHITIAKSRKLIKQGVINRGMIPKVAACIQAVENGVPKAHLINGLLDHSLFFEIFTDKGVGTEIVKK